MSIYIAIYIQSLFIMFVNYVNMLSNMLDAVYFVYDEMYFVQIKNNMMFCSVYFAC